MMSDLYVIMLTAIGFILVIVEANIVQYDWNRLFYDEEEEEDEHR